MNGGDMFGPMRFALQWARAREHVHTHTHDQQAPPHLPFAAADAFRLATVGGADALGLAHAVGISCPPMLKRSKTMALRVSTTPRS